MIHNLQTGNGKKSLLIKHDHNNNNEDNEQKKNKNNCGNMNKIMK